MWILERFIDPEARFHLIPPFSTAAYGTPFDNPEAKLRRSGTKSATEVVLKHTGVDHNEKLSGLARMAHLYEITPWMLPADWPAQQLGQIVRMAVQGCKPPEAKKCLIQAFDQLDEWYEKKSS